MSLEVSYLGAAYVPFKNVKIEKSLLAETTQAR
jgi:hypothetical protein